MDFGARECESLVFAGSVFHEHLAAIEILDQRNLRVS